MSGDTACADHVIAWKTRHALGLDAVPMGVAPGPSDNMILDFTTAKAKAASVILRAMAASQAITSSAN